MADNRHPFTEQIYVSSKEVLDKLKQIIEEGNVRSVILWSEDGKKLVEIPLTTGVAIGGVALLLAPFLSVILAVAAVAQKVRIEIIRNNQDDGSGNPPTGTE